MCKCVVASEHQRLARGRRDGRPTMIAEPPRREPDTSSQSPVALDLSGIKAKTGKDARVFLEHDRQAQLKNLKKQMQETADVIRDLSAGAGSSLIAARGAQCRADDAFRFGLERLRGEQQQGQLGEE